MGRRSPPKLSMEAPGAFVPERRMIDESEEEEDTNDVLVEEDWA